MKKLFYILIVISSFNLYSQNITGKLVDANGTGSQASI